MVMTIIASTPPVHGPAKLVSVWLVTNDTLPGFRMLEICEPGDTPDALADHDEAQIILQYLERADDDAEDLDDFVLTALQVQSWSIAHTIHCARAAKRAMRKVLGSDGRER